MTPLAAMSSALHTLSPLRFHSPQPRCVGLAVEMGDRTGVPDVELSGDPSADTFLLSAISPLGPADQYTVLCAPDPATRLDLIDQLLDDAEAGLRFRLG